MISEELNEHSKTSFKSDDAKIEEAKDLNLEHQEWLAESQLQQTFHEDQELSEGNQVQGKTPVKKIQRYILKGEKREGDQEEDLTVCEVIPLDVRNDESIQYSSENFDSPKYANLNSYNENDHSPVEESLADVIPNEKSDTRIQEIYKLWDNEEEGEEVNETEKNEEDIVVFNVVWEDNADKIDKKENMGSVEVDLEQNGIVQTHRVYTNKNQIEIVKTMPQTKCFNCFACSEQFPTYSGLKEHLAKVHKDVSDAPYCEVCGKNFTCANSLKRHMAIHTGFKPYKCKICGRKFSQGSILKRHVLTHENLKPFNCHICEKSYTQKTNLLCHLKNHGYPTVAESFSCKLCSKTFVHQSGLSRHIKLHKGVRFLCVHCKKSFGDASALARHVKAVHQQQQSQIIDG